MGYNVYQGDELIAENIEEKEYTVEGLEPDTEYSFSVTEVIGDNESEKATVTVKTKPIAVTGVTIAPKTNNLEAGATRQLNVTIEPSNATNRSVTFASDKYVATVDDNGLVTAISEGVANITVTTDDGGHTDTATVNVTDPEPPEPEPEE